MFTTIGHYYGHNKNPLYFDVECMEMHCFFCKMKSRLHYTLRGLPSSSSKEGNSEGGIDTSYIYIPRSQHEEGLVLEGYYDHTIKFKDEDQEWQIVSWLGNSEFVVGAINSKVTYPFGKHSWSLNMTSELSSKNKDNSKTWDCSLKLSMVRTFKFSIRVICVIIGVNIQCTINQYLFLIICKNYC